MNVTYETEWDEHLEDLASRVGDLENNSSESFGVRRGETYEQTMFRLSTLTNHLGLLAFFGDIDGKYLEPAKALERRVEKLINTFYEVEK